ncbi:hypothetical protein MVEN_01943400 [Mycena venus]|uniref:Uncharacterized protein n=1 Tax=Mycena venus TaxID=2733690 RepID=A0A8H6XFR6_9AGAR|nr:hypothetical protein MVEN_01943400 [Mycena venus]
MPTQPWEPEALKHVRAMAKYLAVHAISAQVLAEDPTRRDQMAKELQASKAPHVRPDLRVDPSDDYETLLRGWDDSLAQEATDFQSHFLRLHYAVIASIYYDYFVLSPAIQKYGTRFSNFYQQKLNLEFMSFMATLPHGQLNKDTPSRPHLNAGAADSPSPPPADRANIDLARVTALLASPEALLGISFYQRDEVLAGVWRVDTITRRTTLIGTSVIFVVLFDDHEERFEMSEEGVKDLLLQSCVR